MTLALRPTTSASNLFRRKYCPGSQAMEAGLADAESEWSEEGRKLHELFLTGKRPAWLSVEQKETLDLADFYAQEHLTKLRAQFDIPEKAKFVDEREVPMQFMAADGTPLFPGRADVIRTYPKYKVRAILDAKFGYLDVEHAADNLQTATYAVMRHQQSFANATGVAIIQPRNFGPRLTEAIYTAEQIAAARREIEAIWRQAQLPDQPLQAGPWCHHCKAKARPCPAYAAKFFDLAVTAKSAVELADPEQLERMYAAIAFANKIKDEVYGEMRRRIESGALPGWKLQNTGDTRELTDKVKLYEALRIYFALQDDDPFTSNPFTARAFEDCLEIQWGRLTDLVMSLTGLPKKKAEELWKQLAAPFVTITPKAKRCVPDKDAQKALA